MTRWQAVALIVLTPLFLWLSGGFITFEFNPANWEEGGRAVVVMITGFAWFMALMSIR